MEASGHEFKLLLLCAICMPLLVQLRTARAPSKLVDDTCKKAPTGYQICIDALARDPDYATVADLKALARIILKLGILNSTDTKVFMEKMLKAKGTKPALIKPIKDCLVYYDMAASSFQGALGDLDKDPMMSSYLVRITGDDADYCENVLALNKVHIPSISTRNIYVKIYSEIGTIVIDRIS